jgi:hypothetical protein
MKRQLTNTLLIAGLSALFGAASLSARDKTEIANVPFGFHAQQTALEAGKYTVQEKGSNGLFLLRGNDTGRSVFMQMHPDVSADPNNPKLTFACYGDDCVLAKISIEGSDVSYAVSRSTMEKNLSHKLGFAAMISVPLKAR